MMLYCTREREVSKYNNWNLSPGTSFFLFGDVGTYRLSNGGKVVALRLARSTGVF